MAKKTFTLTVSHSFIGDDQPVTLIFKTKDYGKFKYVAENRGRKDTQGISAKRAEVLQWLRDHDKWVEEKSLVYVNTNGLIVEGRHNFDSAVKNDDWVRYVIIEDHRFNNGTSKKDLLNNILMINTIDTSWAKNEIFSSAVQAPYKGAKLIQELINTYKNQFKWTDVMGLLTQEEDYFSHAAYSKYIEMKVFDNPDYIATLNHHTFRAEINYMIHLMDLFSGTHKKGMLLRAAYSIINKAKQLVDVKEFRKHLLKIDREKLIRSRASKLKDCIKLLIDHYNTSAGKEVKVPALMTEILNQTPRRSRRKQMLSEAA